MFYITVSSSKCLYNVGSPKLAALPMPIKALVIGAAKMKEQ